MRQSIGKGNVKSLLGSPCRQLNESICPSVGATAKTMAMRYGAVTNNVSYVQNGAGGPIQVWAVSGFYGMYLNNGPMVKLRPYGKWRISIVLNVLHQKLPFSGDSDILKCNLVRFRTDIDGNQTGAPDLIQKNGNHGVILEGIPDGAQPTWTWDLTSGPFAFTDFLEIPEQDAYCFMGFDAIFTTREVRSYFSGTISGVNPYNTPVGGNSNSDPLALFNPSSIPFSGPPPTVQSGDWVLPLDPMFANGAVNGVNPGFGGGTGQVIFGLDQLLGVGAWGAPRPTWTADFASQRLSLTALFNWKLTGASSVAFNNQTLTQGQIVSYVWDFGDGTNSTTPNPTHAYPHSGVYTAALTATDTIGETSTFNQVVTVPLIAAFGWSGRNVVRGGLPVFEVTFVDASLGAATYDWDFGDATAHSTATNPIHSYPRGSSFTAILTITDAGTDTSTVSHVITT